MTIQTIFDRMSLYDNQLDLIAGGDDVTRGLTAINLVQDWWEIAAADIIGICQTHDTFTTTANTEFTAWPTKLKRLDLLYLLDSGGVQIRELSLIDKTGGHRPNYPFWPVQQLLSSGALGYGAPFEYYPEGPGGQIGWSPTPDAVYTIRGYGLWAKDDYTAAANTFSYVDDVALVLAPHAAAILRTGLDRDISTQQSQAAAAFKAVAKGLKRTDRSQPASRVYSEMHDA